MLTAVPVAALGGARVFDVEEDLAPPHPMVERVALVGQWFDVTPPAITCDPDDLAGGLLLTDELLDWMGEAGQPASCWMLSGDPVGYTREAALGDRKVWLEEQEFLTAISHFDKIELRLFTMPPRICGTSTQPITWRPEGLVSSLVAAGPSKLDSLRDPGAAILPPRRPLKSRGQDRGLARIVRLRDRAADGDRIASPQPAWSQ